MTEPTTYYSYYAGNWSLINQGMPCCKPGTLDEAKICAASYKLTPAPDYWDGEAGEFKPIKPADPHQAAEAAAYTLTHTPNQPRTTSAQNPLF
jgi:hypothetical protein